MATIGTFTTDRDGFLKGGENLRLRHAKHDGEVNGGQIRTLNLDATVSMEPVNSDKEGAPAFRLYAGDVELGAAWAKTGRESGRLYHQVRLDDPSFPAPIFANLVENLETGGYALIWNRPKRPAKRSASNTRRDTSRH